MARIRSPTRRWWWSSNVPPPASHQTGAVITRQISSVTGTAWKQSSHSADTILLYSIRLTSQRTWATPPISLPTKLLQPAVAPHRTYVAGTAELPRLAQISYEKYDVDDESDDSSDLYGAEGKAQISLKETEFSLKQFAERMGQPNFSAFKKWKKVWVAEFLEKKHQSIIPGQNRLKQQWNGPLHGETDVADLLETFKIWLPLENFENAELIWQQWVAMCLKQCVSEVQEARKKGRWGNKRLLTDLGERAGKKVRGNIPELSNTSFMVMIRCVQNGNNDQSSSMQLRASYTDVRCWEELIDFIEQICGPKEPYCLTAL